MNKHSLYLCYFSLREPLVQTQVLPYLREIKKSGIKISILTFEPNPKKNWTIDQIKFEQEKLSSEGINWYFLTYHKRPSAPATMFDVFSGALFIRRLVKKKNIDILHARVHTSAMMAAISRKLLFGKKPKLLFDIRGFFPEEYTDAGIWKENGGLYKTVKKVEKWLLDESDGFVVLTEKARDILFKESKETGLDARGRPVEVIPCCVDLERFKSANETSRREIRQELGIENRFVAVYVGSFGGWYLTEETADFLGELKKKDENSFALILTQSNPEIIKKLLRERGFSDSDFFVKKVSPIEIPRYLSGADVAVSFIKPCFSKQSSSPTKNAEYLACGLPIIVNSGIGDTTKLTLEDKTGVVIDKFNRGNYIKALEELDVMLENKEILSVKCKTSAKRRFDLVDIGGENYRRIYKKLLVGEGE